LHKKWISLTKTKIPNSLAGDLRGIFNVLKANPLTGIIFDFVLQISFAPARASDIVHQR
jgi:hypothetical protein